LNLPGEVDVKDGLLLMMLMMLLLSSSSLSLDELSLFCDDRWDEKSFRSSEKMSLSMSLTGLRVMWMKRRFHRCCCQTKQKEKEKEKEGKIQEA